MAAAAVVRSGSTAWTACAPTASVPRRASACGRWLRAGAAAFSWPPSPADPHRAGSHGRLRAAVVAALAGLPVVVVNPRQTRDFARAHGTLAKTEPAGRPVLATLRGRRAAAAPPPALEGLLQRTFPGRERRQLVNPSSAGHRPPPAGRAATPSWSRRADPRAGPGGGGRRAGRAPPCRPAPPACGASPASGPWPPLPCWPKCPSAPAPASRSPRWSGVRPTNRDSGAWHGPAALGLRAVFMAALAGLLPNPPLAAGKPPKVAHASSLCQKQTTWD